MKHDINAINVALQLGDCFVPPKGSVIEVSGYYDFSKKLPWRQTIRIDRTISPSYAKKINAAAAVCFINVENSENVMIAGNVHVSAFKEWILSDEYTVKILSVPYYAPPFKKWVRL